MLPFLTTCMQITNRHLAPGEQQQQQGQSKIRGLSAILVFLCTSALHAPAPAACLPNIKRGRAPCRSTCSPTAPRTPEVTMTMCLQPLWSMRQAQPRSCVCLRVRAHIHFLPPMLLPHFAYHFPFLFCSCSLTFKHRFRGVKFRLSAESVECFMLSSALCVQAYIMISAALLLLHVLCLCLTLRVSAPGMKHCRKCGCGQTKAGCHINAFLVCLVAGPADDFAVGTAAGVGGAVKWPVYKWAGGKEVRA